jgi:pantetheine-phosphate adenylyltransferase
MAEKRIGVYPGTFDPVTNGHMDIIHRAARILDKLVVAVAVNAGKGPMFDLEERLAMVREEAASLGEIGMRIEVRGFEGLLVQVAAEYGARIVIRGLRAVSDFDYEFQMASMNAKLAPDIETVCLMASDKYQFIASRLVKEIAILGGDVAPFVSPRVARLLRAKVAAR